MKVNASLLCERVIDYTKMFVTIIAHAIPQSFHPSAGTRTTLVINIKNVAGFRKAATIIEVASDGLGICYKIAPIQTPLNHSFRQLVVVDVARNCAECSVD